MSDNNKYQIIKRLRHAEAEIFVHLEVFGDTLAKDNDYKGLCGLDAIRYYLVQKHNWLPKDVFSMSYEHLEFCLSQEMAGWRLPDDVAVALKDLDTP